MENSEMETTGSTPAEEKARKAWKLIFGKIRNGTYEGLQLARVSVHASEIDNDPFPAWIELFLEVSGHTGEQKPGIWMLRAADERRSLYRPREEAVRLCHLVTTWLDRVLTYAGYYPITIRVYADGTVIAHIPQRRKKAVLNGQLNELILELAVRIWPQVLGRDRC